MPPVSPSSQWEDEQETPPSVWLLIWTIYVAKMATIVIVIWAAHDYEATALIAATIWPWLVLAGALSFGPLIFHLRLRRVRARRAQLYRAEWVLSPLQDHGATQANR